MATVNYMASSSTSDQIDGPSVEFVDPNLNSISLTFSSELESYKSNDKTPDVDYPNRPSNALWKQQKLPAWQPILTSDTVLPAFFLLGIALVPIGVGLLLSSNYVKEIRYEYTNCLSTDRSRTCADIIAEAIKKNMVQKCQCWQNFTLNQDIKAPVFFYYGLSNFYQNHRRYVQSYDASQLEGKTGDLSSYCEPYKERNGAPIAPCGAIANSFFNDTFKLYLKLSDKTDEPIDLNERDIAWPTDKDQKYKNPPIDQRYKYTNPPNWHKSVFNLDNHEDNNGYKYEHLIVWMRTAALPSFRKLWARIDHDQNILWRTKLPKGNYSLLIDYNYPVLYGEWKGAKYFYISNTSWLGGKNDFLGYAYIVVGTICLLLWVLFIIVVKKFGQQPKDIVDIGPKTAFAYSTPKPNYSADDSTQPLRSSDT